MKQAIELRADLEKVEPAELNKIPMLKGLDSETRIAFTSESSAVHVQQGTIIAVEGSPEPPIFFVLSGLVEGYRVALDGRSQTLTRLQHGAAFFIPCALGKDTSAPVSVRARQPSRLMITPLSAFRRLLHNHPSLALAALTELSNKMTHCVRLAGDLGVLSVRARLARLLLELAENSSSSAVTVTHAELAAGVGSVREVVSRHLHDMTEMGLIKVSRGRVELMNIVGIQKETGLH